MKRSPFAPSPVCSLGLALAEEVWAPGRGTGLSLPAALPGSGLGEPGGLVAPVLGTERGEDRGRLSRKGCPLSGKWGGLLWSLQNITRGEQGSEETVVFQVHRGSWWWSWVGDGAGRAPAPSGHAEVARGQQSGAYRQQVEAKGVSLGSLIGGGAGRGVMLPGKRREGEEKPRWK